MEDKSVVIKKLPKQVIENWEPFHKEAGHIGSVSTCSDCWAAYYNPNVSFVSAS